MSMAGDFKLPVLEVIDVSTVHFAVPSKRINEGHDVAVFLQSKAYNDISMFLQQLNRAMFPSRVKAKQNSSSLQRWEIGSSDCVFSENINHIQNLLQELDNIIDSAPPDAGPRRFGNMAFRKWYSILSERTSSLLQDHLPNSLPPEAMVELSSYFLGSFGSSQRLDYGSGHELSFLAFLGCIWKLNGFPASSISGEQERSIVLGIIQPYLVLIRRLIKTYTLEPAGSHGVWGLDDHSFLPYIFGSAQYGPPISPDDQTPTEGSCPNAPDPGDVAKLPAVQRERSKNMYFGAIGFIHDVKKGPFWEHSPMLYDISGVTAGWGKINKGMLKMYNVEVLSKFPVVQHFRFGALFSWERDPSAPPPPPASAHASSQPAKHDTAFDKAAARGPPPIGVGAATPAPVGASVGTQAPWTATNTGTKKAPSAAMPTAVGTSAPWKRAPVGTGAESGMRPTLFSRPETKLRDPMEVDAETGGGAADDAWRMPPPTKAPWAKGS